MNDRTEDVEGKNEALKAIYAVQDALRVGLYDAEWRRQRADDEGSAEIHKKQIEEGQDAISLVRDAVHALRSRLEVIREKLEEVEGEREQWRENWRVAQGDAAHASRRADRLEEAAREVVMWGFDHEHDFPSSDWQETVEHLIDLGERIDRLRSALDSREDEGEPEVFDEVRDALDELEERDQPDCTCGTYPRKRPGRIARVPDTDCPVHADEPEGDEPMSDVERDVREHSEGGRG